MSNFAEIMKKEGIAESRIPEIEKAIDNLHHALSKCDFNNIRIFFAKDIKEHLKAFAATYSIADVTDCGVKNKVTNSCFYATMDGVPRVVLVQRNVPGYKECPEHQFKNWKEAEDFCFVENGKTGLSESEAHAIIVSSMREHNIRDEIKEKGKYHVSGLFYVKNDVNMTGGYCVMKFNKTDRTFEEEPLFRDVSVCVCEVKAKELATEAKKSLGVSR